MAATQEAVQAKLDEVVRVLERHRVLETLAERQQTDKRDLLVQMQRRENLAELHRKVSGYHPADLAVILTSLSPDDRLLVFRQLPPRAAGLALVELDDEITDALIHEIADEELRAAVTELDADDLAYLTAFLPPAILQDASDALRTAGRSALIDATSYPDESVGRLMRQDAIGVREDQTVGDALRTLREAPELPGQTDRLFVIDARHILRGSLLLQDLIRADPSTVLGSIAGTVEAFRPDEPAEHAARAFERYDLVSAPVVDDLGKLIGRITIDAVVDYLRASSQQDALTRAGLKGAEDLFAPVAESVRNRWPWLAFNLLTAFLASRVIGMFESTISEIVALAALMPVVASIGGNTGNQTIALVIRALALDQLGDRQGRLARKELTIAAVNGTVWGTVVGLVALLLYGNLVLAGVMTMAVFLNLIVAALTGVAVPLGLRWAGRDPAHGASVLLTFVTDGMGFLLFLSLARLMLV